MSIVFITSVVLGSVWDMFEISANTSRYWFFIIIDPMWMPDLSTVVWVNLVNDFKIRLFSIALKALVSSRLLDMVCRCTSESDNKGINNRRRVRFFHVNFVPSVMNFDGLLYMIAA